MQLTVSHTHPPIPTRGFDWTASVDPENGPHAHSETRVGAIVQLGVDLTDDMEPASIEGFISVLVELLKHDIETVETNGSKFSQFNAGQIAGLKAAIRTVEGIV